MSLASLRRSARATVGLISDTHGLVRPEALEALRGSDVIVHAGDIGGEPVLEALRAIAPVVAVRGNNDPAPWAFALEPTRRLEIAGASIFVLHDVKELPFEPRDLGLAAVVYGHSHKPVVDRQGGVLWVNPGSAGQRRFKLPVSVARMTVEKGAVRAELIVLDDRSRA